MFYIVVLLLAFSSAQYYDVQFPTPKVCLFSTITIHTEENVYLWENCSPDFNIVPKQDVSQTYNVTLLDFVEITPEGNTVASLSSFSAIPSTEASYSQSSQAYPIYDTQETTTLYDISHENITENGRKIGEILQFDLPGVFTITYSIFNVTRNIPYGKEILKISPASLKFDVELAGWPFQNMSNTLNGVYEVTSNEPIRNCYFDEPSLGNVYTQFVCKGDSVDYLELYPNFALVNDRRHQHDIAFTLINQTKHDGSLFEGIEDDDECEDRKAGQVRSAIFQISIPAFEGPLYYDPEISLLLTGGENSRQGCSNTLERNWTLWILSASFAAFCCILILLVILLGEFRCTRIIIYGKEGARIRRTRVAQKQTQPSDSITQVI